jgi:hypothetical protein
MHILLWSLISNSQVEEEYLKLTLLDLGFSIFRCNSIQLEDFQGLRITLDTQMVEVINHTTQFLDSLDLYLKTHSLKSNKAYQSFVSLLQNQSLILS